MTPAEFLALAFAQREAFDAGEHSPARRPDQTRSRVEWRRCVVAPVVQDVIRAEARAGRVPIATGELFEALWPEDQARGDDIRRRLWLLPILRQLAKDPIMHGWVRRGDPRRHWSGKMVQPWLWATPPQNGEQANEPSNIQTERPAR